MAYERGYVLVKNWKEFQHYKDRAPLWIKLHRGLLDNRDYFLLSASAAKALPLVWLIASENEGALPDTEELAFRLRMDPAATILLVDELVQRSFLVLAATVEQLATPAQPSEKEWGSRHVPQAIRIAVWNRDGGKCRWCGCTENIEYDHVVPISKGGESTLENLQLLCRPCNRKKRTKAVATPAQPLRSIETEVEVETEAKKKTEKKIAPSGVDFGEVSPQVVADFTAHRKAVRAPISQTALDGIRREAGRAGLSLEAALSMCCARGWRGFKAEWVTEAKARAGPSLAPSRQFQALQSIQTMIEEADESEHRADGTGLVHEGNR